MKRFLIITPLLFTLSTFAQSNNFLIVRFNKLHDNAYNTDYYTIDAEKGCDSAAALYALISYDKRKSDKDGLIYSLQNALAPNLYNYFISPTEAINYLLKIGWTLVTTYIDVYSGFADRNYYDGSIGSTNTIPVATVFSRPVFCFRK